MPTKLANTWRSLRGVGQGTDLMFDYDDGYKKQKDLIGCFMGQGQDFVTMRWERAGWYDRCDESMLNPRYIKNIRILYPTDEPYEYKRIDE